MSIHLERLSKRYEGHAVVNDVSLEVADGEMFVLLGPSGSGKSTVLRLIAGLVAADGGRVVLHGSDVTRLPPQRRGVGLVFQNYALFRNMTVSANIEFGLRVRKVARDERRRRRDELLDLVGLSGLGERLPRQLSGGQQQRVALARALAHRPEVLLLDEPFGALDARIRAELRRTIRTIQAELRITTIFVTHDQEEAFELADRLGVMNVGRLLEVGPPEELYLRPQTEFVATFLGKANLMLGECDPDGVRLGSVRFPLTTEAASLGNPRRVQVLFRPEDVAVKDGPEALAWPLLGRATVEEVGFQGSFERILLRLPRLEGVRPLSPPAPFGGDYVRVEASRSQHQARRFPVREGDSTWVGVRRIHALKNPGLSFLLLDDGSPASEPAVTLGGEIARLAHARATILAFGIDEEAGRVRMQAAREKIGRGVAGLEYRWSPADLGPSIDDETYRRHYDVAVHTTPSKDVVALGESILERGDLHLLLVTPGAAIPTRALLCVAVGEPGKEDVLFAARFLRHFGATATILTCAPVGERGRATRFLEAGVRTLGLLGVEGKAEFRTGKVLDEIARELAGGGHDLLILGAPLRDRDGRFELGGVVADVLASEPRMPVLIVRPLDVDPRHASFEARR